jgi:hypothetical protein
MIFFLVVRAFVYNIISFAYFTQNAIGAAVYTACRGFPG